MADRFYSYTHYGLLFGDESISRNVKDLSQVCFDRIEKQS